MKSETTERARAVIILAVGIVIGAILFGGGKSERGGEMSGESSEWICSMHPQIRQENPGKCPLCAMDLIPLTVGASYFDPDAVQLSKEATALANIRTTKVGRAKPVKELRLFGIITPNQRLLRSQSSHISGRIESLVGGTVGESVTVGQVIATVFSPDLLNAQQELIEAKKLIDIRPELLAAAREKLRLWNLSESQISEIEQSGKVSPSIDIKASVGGIVTARRIGQGDYVDVGTVLFDLLDLSSVWTVFDAFESDLPYLRIGDTVKYTLPSIPGRTFSGKISFIEPMLDQNTRTAKVRVETSNPQRELKVGMFANAVIHATLQSRKTEIIIPQTAVLWTGKRSIVYVKISEEEVPTFKLREIELGPSLGSEYVVLSGIFEGEEIVTRGAFVIDASAQLEGRRSMMNIGDGNKVEKDAIEQAGMTVQGNCGMCKELIETAANSITGVSVAIWDSETKQLRLNFSAAKTNPDAIGKTIAAVGYDNDFHKADDRVYNSLHGCCRYRK